MSSSEKENVITGVLKNKMNKILRRSTTTSAETKKHRLQTENSELLALKADYEAQRAANMELNEQVEEKDRAIETMKYQFAMLKMINGKNTRQSGSSTDDRLYSMLNGMRLADAENEAFTLRKKVELLKDEFDAIDTIKNERATAIEENFALKKELKSLSQKVTELSDENEMLNNELAGAESTIEQLQAKVNELEQKINFLQKPDEPTTSEQLN